MKMSGHVFGLGFYDDKCAPLAVTHTVEILRAETVPCGFVDGLK